MNSTSIYEVYKPIATIASIHRPVTVSVIIVRRYDVEIGRCVTPLTLWCFLQFWMPRHCVHCELLSWRLGINDMIQSVYKRSLPTGLFCAERLGYKGRKSSWNDTITHFTPLAPREPPNALSIWDIWPIYTRVHRFLQSHSSFKPLGQLEARKHQRHQWITPNY